MSKVEIAIRSVIDHFELWKCGDDADGYNTAADRLAEVIAKHTPTTKYFFDETGRPVSIEWNPRQAAAQSDYETRIRSAILPSTIGGSVGVSEALRAAIEMCERYAEFIRTVPVDDIECHPYLPELEQVIDDGRAALPTKDPDNANS